eukprot:SAG22_NODE_496_length_9797_cov_4.177241_7_plen_136_part_00
MYLRYFIEINHTEVCVLPSKSTPCARLSENSSGSMAIMTTIAPSTSSTAAHLRLVLSSSTSEISWDLDFKRFGIDKYSDDMLYLMYRRVYDLAGITDKSVNVYLNGKKIVIKSFMDYVNLYLIEYNKYQETIPDR